GWGMGIAGTAIFMSLVYWIGTGIQKIAGESAVWILGILLIALYIWLLRGASKYPDLPDEISITDNRPEPWPTVRSGLYFLIPIGILVWCLTIEQLSPGLSAFWGVMSMLFLMATQRPLMALFRRQAVMPAVKTGL